VAEEAREQAPQRQDPNVEGPESPEQRRRRQRIMIGASAALLVVAILFGAWYYIFERGRVTTDDAYTDAMRSRSRPR
jgi:multidrug resistance efflux pump